MRPLAARDVPDREPVVRPEGDRRRAARPHPVGLPARVGQHEPRDEQAWAAGDCHDYAFAGSFASASAASARSCSASSRFAAASSFFTSFSTARRL